MNRESIDSASRQGSDRSQTMQSRAGLESVREKIWLRKLGCDDTVPPDGGMSPRTVVSAGMEMLDLAAGAQGQEIGQRQAQVSTVSENCTSTASEGGLGFELDSDSRTEAATDTGEQIDPRPAVVTASFSTALLPTKRGASSDTPRNTPSAALASRKRHRVDRSPPPPTLLRTESTPGSAHSPNSSPASPSSSVPDSLAEYFWRSSEITSHSPHDPEEDNRGVNGIGYQKTKAEADGIALKKRRQLEAWRRREESDRRAERRSRGRDRQKRGVSEVGPEAASTTDLGQTSISSRRTVRFVGD